MSSSAMVLLRGAVRAAPRAAVARPAGVVPVAAYRAKTLLQPRRGLTLFSGEAKVPPPPPSIGLIKPIAVVVIAVASTAGGAYLSMELCSFNEEQRLWEPPEDD